MGRGKLKQIGNAVLRAFLSGRQKHPMHTANPNLPTEVNLATSWDKQCGIATYSAYLSNELKKKSKVYVTTLPTANALSFRFGTLGYSIGHSHDIVHVQFEYGIFPSAKLGRTLTAFSALPFYLGLGLGDRRVITTMHEPRKTVSADGSFGRLYTQLLDKVIFSVSDKIIVHTQESRRLLHNVYGVNSAKLIVIPHGSYEQPKFSDKEATKDKLGLKGKTVVTILGFVTNKKGHDLVIPLLPKIEGNVQLVIAGGPQNSQDKQYMANLKKLVEEYGVSDKVTFTGFLDDLTPILNASDVALLPYRYVTDSGVLHLLISYRVPTLASDLPAFKEVYEEFSCLDLFRAGDPNDLFEKLKVLLTDKRHRITLETKCIDMWNATKWSTVAQRHIEIYRETLLKER